MSIKAYRGNRGKNVFEVSNFSKGVNATNSAMPNGYLKELVNMRISPDGISLRPREPYMNYVMVDSITKKIINITNNIGVFTSKQFPRNEYIVDLKGKRPNIERVVTNYRVIDGDTIEDLDTNTVYRFLLVDAPEINTEEGVEAKDLIRTYTNGKPITVLLDSQAPSWVDVYGRTLCFVIDHDDNNLSKLLIEEGLGEFLDQKVTEHYYMGKYPFEGLVDKNGVSITIESFPGNIPVVYKRDLDKEPSIIDDRPSMEVELVTDIYMGDMLIDLELGYSFLPSIDLKKTNKTSQHYDVVTTPITESNMSSVDGLISLVTIEDGLDDDNYSGILTIEIIVPYLDESETTINFDKPYISLKTYKKDIKEVKFEDLSRHSQNLLDKHTIGTESFYGEDAVEKGYPYPSLRAILFKNENGDILSQLQRNKKYFIDPLVALPILDSDTNGFEDLDGYAYKWEVIVHNNSRRESNDEVIHTIDWRYTRNMDGSLVDTSSTFLPILGKTDEELRALWNRTPYHNRFTTRVGEEWSIVNQISKGDILRTPKLTTTLTKYIERYEYIITDGYEEDQVEDRDIFTDFLPDNMRTKNRISLKPVAGEKITVPESETYETWTARDFKGMNVTSAIPFSYYSITAELELSSTRTKVFRTVVEAYADEYNYFIYSDVGELSRLNNRINLFSNSTGGLQVRLFIAPAKNKTGYTEEEKKELDLEAQIKTSAYMPYQSEEMKMPELVNTSTIDETKYVTTFEDMVVLYGGEKHGNLIYMSDFNNVSYFPFKYALDQIPQEIVHIHPYQNILIVFTRSDIWTVEKFETENEYGDITTDFIAKRVLQNIYMDSHLKNTIKTVGKNIMVMLEDRIIFLKPNNFTGDNTDLSYMEVSAPIGAILKDPTSYSKNRLKFYNIFTDEDLFFDLYSEVDNRDFKIVLSTFVDKTKEPYMLELLFNGMTGTWTIRDTMSTAYPLTNSNGIRYMKGHKHLENAVVISDDSGTYKYKLYSPDYAFVDTSQYVYSEHNVVHRPLDKLMVPINAVINLGNMSISNHLNKRFHELQLDISNINSKSIDMAYIFKVDGQQRQSAEEIRMEIVDGAFSEREVMRFDELHSASNMGFTNFKLDLSRFPIAHNLIFKIRANGRGRVASYVTSFNITNDFEIFRFLVIFKEQTSRKVT